MRLRLENEEASFIVRNEGFGEPMAIPKSINGLQSTKSQLPPLWSLNTSPGQQGMIIALIHCSAELI